MKYYYDYYPKFIYIPSTNDKYQAGTLFDIGINIDWGKSDVRDFTIKVFTKQNFEIVEYYSRKGKITNYDGTSPSSFKCSNYKGMGNCVNGLDNCATWEKT